MARKKPDDAPPPLSTSVRLSADAKAALDALEADYGLGRAAAMQSGLLLLLRSLRATTREAALEAILAAQKPTKKSRPDA